MITYVTANHLKDLSSAGQTYEGLGRSQASPVCSAAQFPQISNEDLLETYHTHVEHQPKMSQKLFSVYRTVEHLSHFTRFFFFTKKQVNTCFEWREIVLGCRLPGSNWLKKQWVFLAKKGITVLSKWAGKNWKWGPPALRYRWDTPVRNRSELSKLNYHKEHYLFPSEIACVTWSHDPRTGLQLLPSTWDEDAARGGSLSPKDQGLHTTGLSPRALTPVRTLLLEDGR